MEVLHTFLMIIVVVLSFGVAVIAGQNGLLSARCAARCLTEHKDSLRGGSDRNNHRKFMIDHCKEDSLCRECMKPCGMFDRVNKPDYHNCAHYCMEDETECEKSCEFLYYVKMYKAGSCPRPELAEGFEAVCIRSCGADSDCSENLKCCPNMCGHVCRKPDYSSYNLPPVPVNLTFEERREGRALHVSWNLPTSTTTTHGVGVYVLEHRNTTNQKPVWNDRLMPWSTVLITQQKKILLKTIHAGYWYQYRVAMVTASGTQGYSLSSQPFRSSRDVQRSSPPQNITEGVTTLSKGQVDLTIHWEPPMYSDLPIWKYEIQWVEKLKTIYPKFLKIPLHEKSVPGHVHHLKLRKLKPGTTYHIKIAAIVLQPSVNGRRQLMSRRASKHITTFTPPNAEPDNQPQVYSVIKDLIEVDNLHVVDSVPYFDKGSLKAQLRWDVEIDFKQLVKSYMIFWEPHSCDQEFADVKPYSATSDVPMFEVYDLQFECLYNIRVNAVTKAGIRGKPSAVKLRTPVCEKILVKGKSLPPECPKRVPQAPRRPKRVAHVTVKNNCSIDINITWKHPKSDLPIDSYFVTYENVEEVKLKQLDTDGPVYKQKPVEIRLEKTTSVMIPGLKPSEVYVMKIHAVSAVGVGEPAFVKIYTPAILTCGSDKDPEPPDRQKKKDKKTSKKPTTVFIPPTPGNPTHIVNFTTAPPITVTKYRSVTKYRTTKYRTSIYSTTTQYVTKNSTKLNIYKTIYYLMLFISKLIGLS